MSEETPKVVCDEPNCKYECSDAEQLLGHMAAVHPVNPDGPRHSSGVGMQTP